MRACKAYVRARIACKTCMKACVRPPQPLLLPNHSSCPTTPPTQPLFPSNYYSSPTILPAQSLLLPNHYSSPATLPTQPLLFPNQPASPTTSPPVRTCEARVRASRACVHARRVCVQVMRASVRACKMCVRACVQGLRASPANTQQQIKLLLLQHSFATKEPCRRSLATQKNVIQTPKERTGSGSISSSVFEVSGSNRSFQTKNQRISPHRVTHGWF